MPLWGRRVGGWIVREGEEGKQPGGRWRLSPSCFFQPPPSPSPSPPCSAALLSANHPRSVPTPSPRVFRFDSF